MIITATAEQQLRLRHLLLLTYQLVMIQLNKRQLAAAGRTLERAEPYIAHFYRSSGMIRATPRGFVRP